MIWFSRFNHTNKVFLFQYPNLHKLFYALEFLPQQFTEEINENFASRYQTTLPMVLQKEERWENLHYGIGSENSFADNACAIASLAMIEGYFQQSPAPVEEILQWAGDTYYVPGAGTSWQIFIEFARANQLGYEDLGSDSNALMNHLAQNHPVVVSVGPGEFTTTGHIMVLTNGGNGEIQVYDPNDTPEKNHFAKTFDVGIFQQEALHYWAFWS
ncbi:C39 family peptidase [Enterococcus timonensis]|uniref:C39 family peptidase n=1 Tax=Enterococcus timonensis TaxID=1852364 RepID=UPI0008DB27D4|nr:C39 family peptidase [Enterococcus timonensis]